MVDRNILKTDSIPSLIYKKKRGEHRGYRRDLLSEEAPDNIKNLIFCSQCEGISRKPRLTDGKTFCTPCLKDTRATVDSRVDEIVLQLKSRCPLSTRGCDWLGQLGHIQQHMGVCGKFRIECEIGCGEVLERCETDEHLKKCPLRREQCEYCAEEVQASKANQHISLCPIHPDGEVSCPYKEVGCDVLGIKRKNLDVHLADDSIGHQKLMLREIHQLRSENDKLRDATKNLKRRDKKGWILLALVVLGIAILVAYLHTERDRTNVNEKSIQLNIQSMQSNEQSIQSHDQSIRFLMSNIASNATYLYDYIPDRDKTLQGVEWTHGNVGGEMYYGPIFYLGTCKLRLHVYVFFSVDDGCRNTNYYVTRLRGDYDDVSDTCHITYVHLYSVNTADNSKYNERSESPFKELSVGDEYYINHYWFIYADVTLLNRIIRIYFDIE